MGALNIPSAADIERITRRLRSVSQRLEGIEDALDRLEAQAASASAPSSGAPPRISPWSSASTRSHATWPRCGRSLRRARSRRPRRRSGSPSRIPERLVAGGADAHADLLEPLGIGARGAVARRVVGHREDAGRAGAAGRRPGTGPPPLHRRGTAVDPVLGLALAGVEEEVGGPRRRPRPGHQRSRQVGVPVERLRGPEGAARPSRGRTVSAASRSPNSGPSTRAPQVPIRTSRRAPRAISSSQTIAALGPPMPVDWTVSGSPSRPRRCSPRAHGCG